MQLPKLKARDVMETELVVLHSLTPIERAIETLEEYGISGAPVVDEGGSLVGVFSSTDVLRRDQAKESDDDLRRASYYGVDPFDDDQWAPPPEDYSEELLGRELVGDWMTPSVIAVEPGGDISTICRLMVQERVHRVFVVDKKKLVGVVSTFDIVRALSEPEDDRAQGRSRGRAARL